MKIFGPHTNAPAVSQPKRDNIPKNIEGDIEGPMKDPQISKRDGPRRRSGHFFSRQDIIEKLERHKAGSSVKKSAHKTKARSNPFTVSVGGAPDRPSEVGLNDPNDSNTVEKLKSIIRNGGFNFSEKEKKALSEILGKKGP